MTKTVGIVMMVAALLLCSCAPSAVATKRYFWPLPASDVEPKIEYITFYQSDVDLQRGHASWVDDYVLGKSQPVPLFGSPFGVSSYSGKRIFVSDQKARTVLIMDPEGRDVRHLKNKEGNPHKLYAPLGVCEAADGSVYVVDSLKAQVFKYDQNETLTGPLDEKVDLGRPVAVAVNAATKQVYVVDAMGHRVLVFDQFGHLAFQFGKRGEGPGQFNFPTDVDIDSEGNVYVLDTMNFRVQVFGPTGDYLREFGQQGTEPGSFSIPKGIAVSSQGHVYVTDSMAHKLIVFDETGRYLLTLGDRVFHLDDGKVSPGGFLMPRDIDADENGGVWVVDGFNKMVHKYQYLTKSYLEKFPISQDQIYLPPGYKWH